MTIPYPATCINHDDIECTRGGALVLQTIGFAYALICNLVLILFMGLLVYEIYSQERRRDRYSAETHEVQRTYTRKAAWQELDILVHSHWHMYGCTYLWSVFTRY